MVQLKQIKKLTKKHGKRISREAIKKLNDLLYKQAEEIIKKAARNADFAGRSTIKESDIRS